MATYDTEDVQEAIVRYSREYDEKSRSLGELEENLAQPPLVDDVPLHPDPSLQWEELEVGGVKGFQGLFPTMSAAEISLCFDLDAVAPDRYHWLPLLPSFLTSAGIDDGGEKVPYDEMQERLAREIYSLAAEFAMRPERGRHELRITASGLDPQESRRALEWIVRCLWSPWMAVDNLPRLQDLARQQIRSIRSTLAGREETWVRNPANAIRYQSDPPLSFGSFAPHRALSPGTPRVVADGAAAGGFPTAGSARPRRVARAREL